MSMIRAKGLFPIPSPDEDISLYPSSFEFLKEKYTIAINENDILKKILRDCIYKLGGAASEDCSIEFLKEIPNEIKLKIESYEDCLNEIYELCEWHTDDEADENNESPEDTISHINGLIRQKIKKLLKG